MRVRNIDGTDEREMTLDELQELGPYSMEALQVRVRGRWSSASRLRPAVVAVADDGAVELGL